MPAKRKSWYVAVKVVADVPITEAQARHMLKWDTSLTYEEHWPDHRNPAGCTRFKTPVVASLKAGAKANAKPPLIR